MKKLCFLILFVTVISLTFSSCDVGGVVDLVGKSIFGEDATGIENIEDIYGTSLEERYGVMIDGDDTRVQYYVESLSKFEINGDEISAPDSYKKVAQGNLLIRGGQIINQSGDPLGKELPDISVPSLNFRTGMFANIKIGGGKFSADVKDPIAFFGAAFDGEDLKTVVEFDGKGIKSLTFTYETESRSLVELRYTIH